MEGFRIPACYDFVPYDASRRVKGARVVHYFDVETDEAGVTEPVYEVGTIYTKHVARDQTHELPSPSRRTLIETAFDFTRW